MTHDEYKRQLADAIEALLELPLSNEAAWHILNFLQVMTQLFDERFYPQVLRHANRNRAQAQQEKPQNDSNCNNSIPWDDKIPF